MNLSCLFFVATLFFSVAVAGNDAGAAGAQSTIGGTYYGTTDVLVNANKRRPPGADQTGEIRYIKT